MPKVDNRLHTPVITPDIKMESVVPLTPLDGMKTDDDA